MLRDMAEQLDESRFTLLADETLNKMVEALDDTEDDRLEADLESGVLTIAFEDGTKFVVNSHRAARQIWMAAGATAWHFDYRDGEWRSSKTDEELWATVESHTGAKLGETLKLRA